MQTVGDGLQIGCLMANETITIAVSSVQAQAIRKMALRNSRLSNAQFAQLLFDRQVRNSFTPLVKGIAEDAAKRFDLAVSGGFQPPMERDAYIKSAAEEYRAILAELES